MSDLTFSLHYAFCKDFASDCMAFLSITHTSGFLISTKCERESGQVSLAEGTGLGHSVGGIIGVHPSVGILGIIFFKANSVLFSHQLRCNCQRVRSIPDGFELASTKRKISSIIESASA